MLEPSALNDLIYTNINTQADIYALIYNLVICIAMSFILRSFYIKYSISLTGKYHIGSVLPLLAIIVFLVISVVKSSLALSLGLVGALSIVRFRTPIKEPEELIYLFLAISLGLGYAAGQTIVTTIVFAIIITISYFWLSNSPAQKNNEYNLVINWNDSSLSYEKIESLVRKISTHSKLVRIESSSSLNTAIILLTIDNINHLTELSNRILSIDPSSEISFYETKSNW